MTHEPSTLTPAYGRDYRSRAEVAHDLVAERDFIAQPEGRYINLQQMRDDATFLVRFGKLRKVAVFSVADLRQQQH